LVEPEARFPQGFHLRFDGVLGSSFSPPLEGCLIPWEIKATLFFLRPGVACPIPSLKGLLVPDEVVTLSKEEKKSVSLYG